MKIKSRFVAAGEVATLFLLSLGIRPRKRRKRLRGGQEGPPSSSILPDGVPPFSLGNGIFQGQCKWCLPTAYLAYYPKGGAYGSSLCPIHAGPGSRPGAVVIDQPAPGLCAPGGLGRLVRGRPRRRV